jgi:hypothetical protein
MNRLVREMQKKKNRKTRERWGQIREGVKREREMDT